MTDVPRIAINLPTKTRDSRMIKIKPLQRRPRNMTTMTMTTTMMICLISILIIMMMMMMMIWTMMKKTRLKDKLTLIEMMLKARILSLKRVMTRLKRKAKIDASKTRT